jgi:uncharacterized protein YpbB
MKNTVKNFKGIKD